MERREVENLMIGDYYISMFSNECCRLNTTYQLGHLLHYPELCCALPTTDEWLVANGWDKNGTCFTKVFYYDMGELFEGDVKETVTLDRDPYGNLHFMHNGTSFCVVNEVHELQHALRLLGIELCNVNNDRCLWESKM